MDVNTVSNIINYLTDVGYQGGMTDQASLHKCLDAGLKSSAFINLVVWLSNEIRSIGNLEEKIEPCDENQGDGMDTSGFMMELSAFLKELSCPYDALVTGHMSSRLQSYESRVLLIDYLLSELMCFKVHEIRKPSENAEINLQESTTANTLKQMLIALGFNKPPDNITTNILFDKLLTKMKDVVKQAGPKRVGQSMLPLTKPLSPKQWTELETLQGELEKEYQLRREMLLTRLDVTIQSFQWSERAKGHEDAISRLYTVRRNTIDGATFAVRLQHLLAARDDLAIIEKTSSANVRKNTKSHIHDVIIGRVPDRGGRPHEQAPPPPEMPSWQQQRSSGPAGGGGGGNRGGGNRGGGNRGGQGGGRGGGGGGYQQNQQQNRGGQSGSYQQTQSGDSGYQGNNSSRVQGQWNQSAPPQTGGYSNRGGGYSNRGGGYSNRGGYNQSGAQNTGYNQGGYSGRQDTYDNNQQGYDNTRQGGGYQQKGNYRNQQDGYSQGNNQGYYNRGNRY